MGRGEPTNRTSWPTDGPERRLLELFDRVRSENGMKSLREIAQAMSLQSPTRVNRLLRGGGLPVDDQQLEHLVRALGGSDEDVRTGWRLYAAIRASRKNRGWSDAQWWSRSGYVDQVRQIAPADGLEGRDEELTELAAFCRNGESYVWWVGDPWAGKSALMSAFALSPPPGADVVSFFVTARLSAQSDGPAFIDALLDQLSAFMGESLPPLASAAARDAHFRRLLRAAAARAKANARRLVLLVDGLDEDRGFSPEASLPSIASLLPKVPETAMRVIVSSRPTSPLPDDVPADHPLRRCRRRQLTTSTYATEIARLARIELSQLPLANALHRDTIGFITASGGGLTLVDLEHLTGAAPFQLEQLLSGTFGRTIPKRERKEHGAAPVYLFAHETLREEAVRQFGTTLDRYRSRIHLWADTYAERGWPPDTPAFLLEAYPRLLRDSRDTRRLCVLVLDSRRQDRLLVVTGGDAAAFTEIAMAQDLQVSADQPDLAAMVLVAERRDSLATRNAHIPVALPAVWVALGQDVRAEALAQGMTDMRNQSEMLTAMAAEYGLAGRYQQALDVAASAVKASAQIDAYVGILEALDDPPPEDVVGVIGASAADGLSRITDDEVRAWLTAKLAVALARVRDYEHAAVLLDSVEYLDSWLYGAADIVRVAARHGDAEQAAVFLEAIDTLASDEPDNDGRQQAQVALVRAAALSGDIDKAVLVAEQIADTTLRVQALTYAAGGALTNGDHGRAASLAREVDATVRGVPGTPTGDLLELLADAFAYAGDLDAAQTVARSISNDVRRDATLSTLVRRLAIAGNIDLAERVAREIEGEHRRRETMTALVSRLAERGDYDHARRIADSSEDPAERAAALTALAHELAHVGNDAEATSIAMTVERIARSVAEPAERAKDLVDLADALMLVDRQDLVRRIAHTVQDMVPPASFLLLRLMIIVVNLEDYEWAATLARTTTEPPARSPMLGELAGMLVAHEQHRRAEALLAEIPDDLERIHAISRMVWAMVKTGHIDGLAALLDKAQEYTTMQNDPASRAEALDVLIIASTLLDNNRAATAIANSWAIMEELDRPDLRARAATSLARSAAKSGQRDHAEALLRIAEQNAAVVGDAEQRDEIVGDLATGWAALGQYEQAETVAAGISNFSLQSFALRDVVGMAADAGRLELAELMANNIRQLDERVKALAAIVRAVAASDPGRADRLTSEARRVAQEIGWVEETSNALSVLVGALTKSGRTEQAREVADSIELSDFRAEALLSIVDSVEQNVARRLVAEAIVAGRWTISLYKLAQVDPTALASDADELLSGLPA